MSYAAPLAYAANALSYDPYAGASHHPRPVRQRRRRMRMTLLPALRPRRQTTAPATLATGGGSSR
ncbi:MAG: hypothetical protein H0T69_06745 [Thermoleophilaceae bacterium]|nr:hypothetical protein [Thermoleophilaceae bacterium]